MLRRATAGRQPRRPAPTTGAVSGTMRTWPDERSWSTRSPRFALFADLPNPQLEGIVHLFEEAVFGEGEKVLRQGLTGSGFYVILDGEAAVVVDGTERARLGRGEFFGEVSIILGESPIADVVATPAAALPGPRRTARRAVPRRPPAGHVADAPGAGAPAAGREPMAELSAPVPAGRLPGRRRRQRTRRPPGVVLAARARASTTRSSRPIRRPAGCSAAGRSSSGSCRGRSRTPRPCAAVRAYERYDWNSLLERRARHAARSSRRSWTARSYFPSRPEMEANLAPVRRARRGRRSATAAAGPATRQVSRRPTATGSRSRRPTACTAAGCWSSRSGWPSRTRRPASGWSTPTTTPTSARSRSTPTAGS